ncbi:GNAT family N-acetyltransferase [Lacibacter sp.]|jgi:GNAT superfamily N-acetyltransferase|uniref:GNAT family N-acetyltransferase n=1 Tax=Lacibacter sp. TaxID=1915409 RepID=UPI002B4B4B38|nr:GNAT family N-acetyltransferase [Lacibacter sp.]HLP37811.1 GNAT family N-acetyltransferase [Lacibacter sp.]
MQREGFAITTETSFFNLEFIHAFLSKSYWAENIPMETVQRSIDNSISFGVFHLGRQIGFARVITDKATFAYLADVFIDEAYRGQGLSKWMMEEIMAHPDLQGLRRMMLATRDAHGLYAQFGFEPLTFTDRWMQIHKPGIYKNAEE